RGRSATVAEARVASASPPGSVRGGDARGCQLFRLEGGNVVGRCELRAAKPCFPILFEETRKARLYSTIGEGSVRTGCSGILTSSLSAGGCFPTIPFSLASW